MKITMYAICQTTTNTPVFAVCKIPYQLMTIAVENYADVHKFVLFNKWESSKEFIFDRKYWDDYATLDSRDNKYHPNHTDLYPIFTNLDKLIVDLEQREGEIDGENIYIAGSSKQQCLEVISHINASISNHVERYICEVL